MAVITGEMRFVQLGGEKIETGRRWEDSSKSKTGPDFQKDLGNAKTDYMSAAQYFLEASRASKIPTSVQLYKTKARELINRCEEIGTILKNAAAPVAVAEGGGKGGKEDKKNEDKELQDSLAGAIITETPNVKWSDVAGLEVAKQSLREAVVLPLQFPELFKDKRKPWKGILLYGPPGTGKSFLAKAVATEVKSTFLSVSSSDIMSKWVGQSEKLVKQLFVLARDKRPSIVFIDEIDSMAGKRGDNETEGARRVKTELLVQMEGVGADNDQILFLGATNTPWDLDSAVRRRFEKRIYIPLPDVVAREAMFKIHLGKTPAVIDPNGFRYLAQQSEGYSGADISIIVRDALMQPIRRLQTAQFFRKVTVNDENTGQMCVKYQACNSPNEPGAERMTLMQMKTGELYTPPVTIEDMIQSLSTTRPSVSKDDITRHVEWTKEFGRES